MYAVCTFGEWGVSQVVVEELAELHEHMRVFDVRPIGRHVHRVRHHSGARQWVLLRVERPWIVEA